mgnify:CR=1 FL=1
MDPAVAWLLGDILADPQARVAILTAAGDKAFCAGMDLKEARGLQLAGWPRELGGIVTGVILNFHSTMLGSVVYFPTDRILASIGFCNR